MNISDILITSIETLTAFDVATGDYLYTLDELQNVSIANTQETSEITGKQGRKLANLKRNKGVTISGASGIISGGLMESQTGSKFETKATDVMWTDYLEVDESHKANTRFKAVGTTGAEIVSLRLKAKDGTPDKALEQDESAEQGKFKYDPLTKELEFSEDVQAGQEIIVQYKRKLKSADVLVNESDTYSGKAIQYPIFIGGSKHLIKGDGNGGARTDWWELSVHHGSATNVCYVSTNGNAATISAAYTPIRAPLCFRIG